MNTMNAKNSSTRNISHPLNADMDIHLYAVGQAVRLRGHFRQPLATSAGVYRVTRTLPPIGAVPQYRIRNEDERCERVVTQDWLEPMDTSSSDENSSLIEKTFGQS